MLTMERLAGLRVFMPRKERARRGKPGRPEAESQGPKRYGKVHNLVFAPDGRRVVGIMVKRPDIAGMVKRDDVFVALDSFEVTEQGLLCSDDPGAFDEAACKRLGLDFDRCIIWGGMGARTVSGKYLGYVMDARFSERTGDVDCFCAQEGSTASALLGSWEIPAAWLVGYSSDCMVVRDEAANLELSGGLAARAGEGYANAKEGAKRAVAKADDAASKAVDKGSHALGTALGKAKVAIEDATRSDDAPAERPSAEGAGATRGSGAKPAARTKGADDVADMGEQAAKAVERQLGKTKGMFSNFMREFKDASK